ncbi:MULTISPECIES: 2,3,4,5-tetrahydropyridine-2,6-dicarboxylate N-succinyltransferase [unclassified Candidatus Tisiphia]|uniref:2,3,4,5-tetrahydropyridine-2,6-dicarboxylate N-succinyltransferase n=1 Tax=unclassified Candidatus Tisiphia TaxID=2996318 RepID=UPI00312C8766
MQKHINTIEEFWQIRDKLTQDSEKTNYAKQISQDIIDGLNQGLIRVCEKEGADWQVNHWIKKAILLHMMITVPQVHSGDCMRWYDKISPKFSTNYNSELFRADGCRIVPGAIVRTGVYLAKNVVVMPSFINIGAYVGEGTMVDTWATIGSCAQIGRNCHISGGTGIGGVLEPIQNNPVIIEDNCFIGARSEIAEGVLVEEGSVISMGVFIGASTKIVDRASGKIIYGKVPAYSVVVPGSLPADSGKPSLYCAVIVKQVDAGTRSKVSINDLLRGN